MLFAVTAALTSARIRILRRMQELGRHAGRAALAEPAFAAATAGMTTMAGLELGFARLSATLGPCAHPAAEPVDLLLTGERVAWICPDCNADLPAGWAPQAPVQGTLTASGGAFSVAATLSGAGSISARHHLGGVWSTSEAGTCTCPPHVPAPVGVRVYNAGSPVICYCAACGKRIREDEGTGSLSAKATWDDVAYASEASAHFAALAKVGLEFCISPCRMCAERRLERGRK